MLDGVDATCLGVNQKVLGAELVSSNRIVGWIVLYLQGNGNASCCEDSPADGLRFCHNCCWYLNVPANIENVMGEPERGMAGLLI